MTTKRTLSRGLLVLAVAAALGACSTIAHYNPIAYQNATSLKVECLAVVDKSTEPYADHKSEAEKLQSELDKAYEFAKGMPKNEVVTKMWAVIRDPAGHLAGGVLAKWKAEGKLSDVFAKEAGGQIAQGFDQLIALEGAKITD
jgi:hypothetical protein